MKLYSHIWESKFDQKGFKQGIGFNVKVRVLTILGFRFVTDIRFEGTLEWLEDLKKRLQ